MILLTLFLLLGGLLLLLLAIWNQDWLYKFSGPPRVLYALLGRPATRCFYILMGIVMSVWGGVRMANPPPKIQPQFIFELAKPLGVNPAELTSATAVLEADKSGEIQNFKKDNTGWVSFSVRLKDSSPNFEPALKSSTAGPDFSEGFHLNERETSTGKFVGGRILYFDAELQSCDNVLFSKTPLGSAAFIMVICNPEISAKNGASANELLIYFFRKGTPDYKLVDA